MHLCFLKPTDLVVPSNIKVLVDYGYESVWTNGHCVAKGTVIYIDTTHEALISWLGGQEIWVGNGMVGFHKEKIVKE